MIFSCRVTRAVSTDASICVHSIINVFMCKLMIICHLFVTCRGSHPQQVAYGGRVLGESAIETEEQIGNRVVHSYDVS